MNWQGRHEYEEMKRSDIQELRREFNEEEIRRAEMWLYNQNTFLEEYSIFAICLLIGAARNLKKAKKAA